MEHYVTEVWNSYTTIGYESSPVQLYHLRIWEPLNYGFEGIALTTDGEESQSVGRLPILKTHTTAPPFHRSREGAFELDLVVKRLEGHNSQSRGCRSLLVALEFVIFAMQMQLHDDDDDDDRLQFLREDSRPKARCRGIDCHISPSWLLPPPPLCATKSSRGNWSRLIKLIYKVEIS
jgi:hypothetical protein